MTTLKKLTADGLQKQIDGEIVFDNGTKKLLLKRPDGFFAMAKLITATERVEPVSAPVTLKLSMPIFDTRGKALGEVADMEFTSKGVLKKILTEQGEFLKSQVAHIDDAVMIKIKTPPKPKSAKPVVASEKSVAAAPTEKDDAAQADLPKAREGTPVTVKIPKKYGDFRFLVGKTVDKTIVNLQGEVMLKIGETVTLDALRQAKISGKLLEICLHVQ